MNDASAKTSVPVQGMSPGPMPGLLLGVFLVSAATLHLEILQTRIFALALWHHVTYLVVTFTLLGFAASGTLLTLMPAAVERSPRRFLAICALLFSLTSFGAFELLCRTRLDTLELLTDRAAYLWVFAYYLYLVVPFVLAGLAIGAALKIAGPRTGLVYGVNLAGSALGCLLFAFALRPLGGPGSVLLASACAAAAAAAFASGGLRIASGVVALAFAALIPFGDRVLPIDAAPGKPMGQQIAQTQAAGGAGRNARIETTRWDPLCRIDVVNFGDDRAPKRIYQDGDAPTEILPKDAAFDPLHFYSLPYFVQKAGRGARSDNGESGPFDVLAIGIGGGMDLLHAHWNGARLVTGVEINATTDELMRGEYAEFSGDVYTRPGVQMVVGEGRSWVRRAADRYDVIQMTGTDTFTALASGSYVLSESYLYTFEAFRDYFDHLRPGGFVSVLRFRFVPPRESLRLVAIAIEALKARGVEHPEKNVLVVDQIWRGALESIGEKDPLSYSSMLFKESPLVPEEIAAAKRWVAMHPYNAGKKQDEQVFSIGYAPGELVTTEYGEYLQAVARGREAEYAARYPVKIDVVHDDSPYFFNYHRWSSLLEPPAKVGYLAMTGRDPIGLFLLLTALIESTLLVVLLVVLPLLLSRRTRLPVARRAPVLLYFLGLGCGFLFLEVAAMQRFVLYLGHPTRSLTVVLFSFLLFSGLGAAVAGRLQLRSARLPLLLVVAITALYAWWQPRVLDATLGLSTAARIGISIALLAPPAFLMGMPFPTGLSRLKGEAAPFLPWALAINGGASVVASVVAILVAMETGFTMVFGLAAASYLVAFLVAGRLPEGASNAAT